MEEDKKERKVIELTVDDINATIDKISLVSAPAIEVDFYYFSKLQKQLFEIESEDQQIIIGPAMVPDKLIPRINPETGEEFDVKFSKETIFECAQKFFRDGDINKSNLEHEHIIQNVTVFQSWFINKKEGITGGNKFKDLPDGTWMCAYKIWDKNIWNEFIKSGIIKGFSVEGVFVQNFMKEKFGKSYDDILYKMSTIINSDIEDNDKVEILKSLV